MARLLRTLVENLAGTFFPMLALSGLWRGVNPRMVREWLISGRRKYVRE